MTEQVGTNYIFNMTVDDLIKLAFEGLSGEHITAKDSKLARTSLNLIFTDMQNKGFAPLSSMTLESVPLVSGSSNNYVLTSSLFNIMGDAVINVYTNASTNTDLPIQRIDYGDWLRIPNKNSTGRPTQYLLERKRTHMEVTFWPVPDKSNYTFKAWGILRIADVDKSYQLPDVPHRYLPAVLNGLRYYMATLKPGMDINEKMYLKQEYGESLQMALDEDRMATDFGVYPLGGNVL